MIFWICGSFNCLFMVAIVWTEKNENKKLLAISKSCYDDFKGALRKKNRQVISGSKTLRLNFPSTIFCILLWNIEISRCCIKTFILPTPFLCISSYKKPLSDYRPKTPPNSNLVNNFKKNVTLTTKTLQNPHPVVKCIICSRVYMFENIWAVKIPVSSFPYLTITIVVTSFCLNIIPLQLPSLLVPWRYLISMSVK